MRRWYWMVPAAAIFVGLAVLLYAMSWNSRYAGFLSDDAVYLLMADAFSPYRTSGHALMDYVMRHSLFPPLYPLLLASVGGGSAGLLVSHWFTTTTLIGSLLVYACWTYLQTGSRLIAISLLLVFAMLPRTLLHNLEILSEFPYLLFSLIALWLASRSTTRARESVATIAICVGLAAATRSAGLSLVLAFAAWLAFNRIDGKVKWVALAIAPSLAWAFYKTYAIGAHNSYFASWWGLWRQLQEGSWSFLPHFILRQSAALWHGLLLDLDFRPVLWTKIILALTLVAGLPVWINRLRHAHLDAWYLLTGGGMLLLYPFPSFFPRLLLPWIPIVLLYACLGVKEFSGRWMPAHGRHVAVGAFLAALCLAALPSTGFMLQRFAAPIAPGLAAWKHTRYWYRFQGTKKIQADLRFRQSLVEAARQMPQWVPENDCVFAVFTAMPMLYSRRIVELPPAPSDGTSRFDRLSKACNYYFLMATTASIGSDRVGAFYPYRQLPKQRIEIVHVWTDDSTHAYATAMLLRLKPST